MKQNGLWKDYVITDVTECTVKELVANETERAVMANGAGMTQYATIELTIDAAELIIYGGLDVGMSLLRS